jgi:RNA polymerase sigma-70 factor, ECF subfamily
MTSTPPSAEQLDAWVSKTSRRALGYAVTLVRNQQDAEDIVHDCYRRLLAHSDRYDLVRDGTKLLFRAVTNACINHTQRRPAEGRWESLELSADADQRAMRDLEAAEPSQEAMRRELEEAVGHALAQLPVPQRAAIELRSLGHSLMEVAEMLDVSYANARVILHRARTTLAAKLQPFIEEPLP